VWHQLLPLQQRFLWVEEAVVVVVASVVVVDVEAAVVVVVNNLKSMLQIINFLT